MFWLFVMGAICIVFLFIVSLVSRPPCDHCGGKLDNRYYCVNGCFDKV